MLRRSDTNRMLGGVCGGLSEHTGIDVVLFRVGFVVLVVAGGAGLLLYLALWLLLPDSHGAPGSVQRWLAQRPSATARNVILVLAALFVAAAVLGGVGADAGVVALLAVAALAYLWARDRRDTPAEGVAAPAGVLAADPVTAIPARPPRQRSALGRVTISVLLIALGLLALLDRQTTLDVSTSGYLGVALGIVGAGLLAGTFWGRSRGLIFLGLPLMVLLIAVSALDISLRDGIGGREWDVPTADALESTYSLGAGHGRLDLSTVDFQGADAATSVTVNVGYAEVLLPPDVDVHVVSTVRAGAIELFGTVRDASDLRRTVSDDGLDGPGGGRLDLVLDVNLGFVEVSRVR